MQDANNFSKSPSTSAHLLRYRQTEEFSNNILLLAQFTKTPLNGVLIYILYTRIKGNYETYTVCVLRLSYDYGMSTFRNPDKVPSSSLILTVMAFEIGADT